jgi:hypothetical protein
MKTFPKLGKKLHSKRLNKPLLPPGQRRQRASAGADWFVDSSGNEAWLTDRRGNMLAVIVQARTTPRKFGLFIAAIHLGRRWPIYSLWPDRNGSWRRKSDE